MKKFWKTIIPDFKIRKTLTIQFGKHNPDRGIFGKKNRAHENSIG